MRKLGERSGGAPWVSTVHRAPVCVLITPPPPPTRPLATFHHLKCLQNAHQVFPQERFKLLTCQALSATLCVLRQPPKTTNDLQWSSSTSPLTSNVFLRSATFSWTLAEFYPWRCSVTEPLGIYPQTCPVGQKGFAVHLHAKMPWPAPISSRRIGPRVTIAEG